MILDSLKIDFILKFQNLFLLSYVDEFKSHLWILDFILLLMKISYLFLTGFLKLVLLQSTLRPIKSPSDLGKYFFWNLKIFKFDLYLAYG